MFAWATLLAVGAVVVLALTDDGWGVVFAIAMLIALLAIVPWEVERSSARPVIALEPGG